MIFTITRGADFRDLLRYVLGARHNPTLVATNTAGQDVATLTWELTSGERERRLRGRPKVEKPVVHVSLSLARGDRRLSQAELSLLAERFLEGTGYGGCYYAVVEHRDRPHQHVHLVISRVRSDGSLAREQLGDFHRAMEVCRQIEREFGLRRLEPRRGRGTSQASRAEYEQAARTFQRSERSRLLQLISEAMRGQPSLTEFVSRLDRQAVTVRLLRADDGPVLGISYRLERFAFKGASIGPSYTWQGIQREGVSVEPKREGAVIDRLARRLAAATRPPSKRRLEHVRTAIDEALSGRPSHAEFVVRLEAAGVGVRLNVVSTGQVSGISYVIDGRPIKGSQLGRKYSWHGLRQRGLSHDAGRSTEIEPRAAEAVATRAWTPAGVANPLAFVRDVLRDALAGRPTLTEFVHEVESRGIQVRLYHDGSGTIYAAGFGLGRLSISGQDLGPDFAWSELKQRLDLDDVRDHQAIERVAEKLTPAQIGFHTILHIADNLAYAASVFREGAEFVGALAEDPVGALGRAATRAAWRLSIQGLSEFARQAA